MPLYEAIVLGITQGLTEFIPISSSGHLILVRSFFQFDGANGLAVDAILQLATALAVLVYFWRDLFDLAKSFFYLVIGKEVLEEKKTLLYAITVGTIPAIFFGLLLQNKMETIFRDVHLFALMLIAGSLLMLFAEKLYKANSKLSVSRALKIGIFQSLALVPGVSRSGATISGGMILGLDRNTATRFSFLLSVPIIIGSGLMSGLDLANSGALSALGLNLLISFFISFIVGLFAIRFLISFLQRNSLKPFIIYRIILAGIILFFL